MHDLGSMKAAYTAATLDTDLERTQLVSLSRNRLTPPLTVEMCESKLTSITPNAWSSIAQSSTSQLTSMARRANQDAYFLTR
jgi:hypothetical protein